MMFSNPSDSPPAGAVLRDSLGSPELPPSPNDNGRLWLVRRSLYCSSRAAINWTQQLRREDDSAVVHRAADGIPGLRIERSLGMYAHEKSVPAMGTAQLGGEMQHGFFLHPHLAGSALSRIPHHPR